jgi:sugar phosphate isomerase/epimerase
LFVGLHCGPFRDTPLDDIAKFASSIGAKGLEVMVGPDKVQVPIDKVLSSGPGNIKKTVEKHDVVISSLAYYTGTILTDKDQQAFFKKSIEACATLDVGVLCCLAGGPSPGKNKKETLRTDFKEVYSDLADHAKDHDVKLAMENWFATLLQGLDNFDLAFEMVPHDNFGLNFDPSHLVHQQIDHIEAVHHLAKRIFHTHAKDTEINYRRMHYRGILESGWWRYRIPGRGEIDWNAYITALKENGYDSVLSIEHEDGFFGREEGFKDGTDYLNSIIW